MVRASGFEVAIRITCKCMHSKMRTLMNTHQMHNADSNQSNISTTNQVVAGEMNESAEQRVQRLYSSEGGPLIGWLFDEARRRRHDYKAMSKELGVTYGYINQLRTGLRNPAQISQNMVEACARYVGVPPVVIKLISGSLRMSDFATRYESKEALVERQLQQMQDDPHVRKLLPHNLSQLPVEAKEAIVLMYAEVSGRDVLGLRELPNTLHYLQRAAVIHDENEYLMQGQSKAVS